jgi:hypothetical protein
MTDNTTPISTDFERRLVSFVGKLGLLISILLIPPVFTKVFAVSEFLFNEKTLLWVFSSILFGLSLFQILFSKKIKASIALLFFVILFFILIELFTRIYVKIFYEDDKQQELGMLVNKTHEEFIKYKGHPFLAYTGNPATEYVENNEVKKTTQFNNMGFVGEDFKYEKAKDVIRIACIGGSTTERGYPAITEYELNKFFHASLNFEVMNFGVSGWTSANSLTNFILNVREFNPDYVLIHHGWNEDKIRNTPENLFRTDYSHALTYFHEPEIIDKVPIRISVLYRILKNKYSHTPDWMFLGDATILKNRPKTEQSCGNIKELNPFIRNIETIIKLCLQSKTKVILSTQPFSLTINDRSSISIEQANNAIRKLCSKYKEDVIFLDLDSAVTGHMNDIFTDLAHMNITGNYFKGAEFARVLINDITEKDTAKSTPPHIKECVSYQEYVNSILNDKTKRKDIVQKAKERNLTTHQMLKKDAFDLFSQKKNIPSDEFNYRFQEYKIRANKEWMGTIVIKAKERGISIDEMVENDVNYMLKK